MAKSSIHLRTVGSPNPAPSRFYPGYTLAGFTILRKIGRGAFADVYLAKELQLDRLVALKISRKITQEAQLIAGLEHDHIVTVFSNTVLERENLCLINMQYVEGGDLAGIMSDLSGLPKIQSLSGSDFLKAIDRRTGKTLFDQDSMSQRNIFSAINLQTIVINLGCDLARALHFAHEKHILHLDIKPGNILVSSNSRAFLSDFNVALTRSQLESGASLSLGGTLRYMAPEHRELYETRNPELIDSIGPQTDVFSLGKVLQELLLGTEPDKPLRQVLDCATEDDAANRFKTALEFSKALAGCGELFSITARFPQPGLIVHSARKSPFLALTLWGAIPQLAAVAAALFFNTQIVFYQLSQQQVQVFSLLNTWFLPFILFVMTAAWLRGLSIAKNNLDESKKMVRDSSFRLLSKKQVLMTPKLGLWVSGLGWLSCAVIYPLVIGFVAAIPAPIALILFLNFVLAWIIATAYSYLLHQKIVLQVLYPMCFWGDSSITEISSGELARIPSKSRFFSLMTGVIPLLSAVLALFNGELVLGRSQVAYKLFVSGLIGLGTAGMFFSIPAIETISALVLAFQKKK
ncbi:MAG: serine/threonine protein kinase [Proteobacteria bacterium]|nr:serine/threonine protein kinase [Pseudomonadota bacterium]